MSHCLCLAKYKLCSTEPVRMQVTAVRDMPDSGCGPMRPSRTATAVRLLGAAVGWCSGRVSGGKIELAAGRFRFRRTTIFERRRSSIY
jgi:hypothetical protein